jgi:prepilin-type N-terminal cleavage/methylation domain-containing protein
LLGFLGMNRRGFTLIELAITLVIIAILAAATIAATDARRRNTAVETTALELVSQAQGLRFTALAEQRDHLLVVASAPGNDSTRCGMLQAGDCVRAFVLRAPQAGWNVAAFDADAPGVLAELVDSFTLAPGTVLDLPAVGIPAPAPFQNAWVFAPDVTANCAGGRTCLAVRFAATGEVRPEYVAAPGPSRGGVALGLTSDLAGLSRAAQHRAVFVSFPSGTVRSFPY